MSFFQVSELQIVPQRLQLTLHVGRVRRLFALLGLERQEGERPKGKMHIIHINRYRKTLKTMLTDI